MKCIIAGSRDITDFDVVDFAFSTCPFKDQITEVVSGMARGVDQVGERVAFGRDIVVSRFPADWRQYKSFAGTKRNMEMGDYADCAIIIWDGESKGSKHMHDYMVSLDKPVHLIIHRKDDKNGKRD